MNKLSDYLKTVRTKKDWSQEDLARHLDVSLSSVQRWESDRCAPSRAYRKELNTLFNEFGLAYHFGRGRPEAVADPPRGN